MGTDKGREEGGEEEEQERAQGMRCGRRITGQGSACTTRSRGNQQDSSELSQYFPFSPAAAFQPA